jgi:hypothetical protein
MGRDKCIQKSVGKCNGKYWLGDVGINRRVIEF